MRKADHPPPKDDRTPPQGEVTELIRFKTLAMRVLSVSKDEIVHIDSEFKMSKSKKNARPAGSKTTKAK